MILTSHIREYIYHSFEKPPPQQYQKNRRNVVSEQEEQMIYDIYLQIANA